MGNSANISVGDTFDSIIGSTQEKLGATVDLAASLNGITGPSAGESIVGNIANGIGASLVDNLKGGLGGFLGAAFGNGFGTSGSGKLPNPLEQYASFNYIFTLGCLSDYELSFPDLTYRRKDPGVVILRSGGGQTNGASTLYDRGGKTEYFIDDVNIETIIAPNPKSRSTNATSIDFTVTEPYSMGLFLQSLQVAAKNARGPSSNYIEAPYLLTVEFKGYDDAGNYVHASNLRRMFPLKLVDIQFEVTEGGSQYAVQAIPYQEIALTDETQSTHSDITFSGATVTEMLQTGANSFTRFLNERQLAQEEAGQVGKADQYIIMFPTADSSAAESQQFMQGQPEQEDDSATTREFTEEEVTAYYVSETGDATGKVPTDYAERLKNADGISLKRSSLGEDIREYAEKLEFTNKIGKSLIVKSQLDAGTQPMAQAANSESENTAGEIDVCRINRSADVRSSTVSSGKKIQNVIEEIIIRSGYGRDVATKPEDGNGMIEWFRIQTQVFNSDDSIESNGRTGSPARVFVYRVVPYLVHKSHFQGSTDQTTGIRQLTYQAIKEYNYIYTGENKDILNFDIKFDAAFFASINGDNGQLSKDSLSAVTGDITSGNTSGVPGKSEPNTAAGTLSKVQSKVPTANRTDVGGLAISPESQIAKDFNEALMNSPVDLIAVDLEILGDPYYIADSGMGNYNALTVPGTLNINSDGTMEYLNGEVDIELNFRTPLDYGQTWMEFPSGGTAPVAQFSGLYQVLFVSNKFSGGQFTQILQTMRRPKQETSGPGSISLGALNLENPAAQLAGTFNNIINGDPNQLVQSIGNIAGIVSDPLGAAKEAAGEKVGDIVGQATSRLASNFKPKGNVS
jgi:hypothetical protein|tara:strand:+ start:1819 stop:4380 length:2562 start_codon:yes stop_codon:yes gene_type:complete